MERCDVDIESLMLAIQLQREDIEERENAKKGKQREGEMIDSEVALEACRRELEEMAALVSDQAICISIAKAVESDALLIAEAIAAEEQAASDHDLAWRLSGLPRPTPAINSPKSNEKKRPADHLDDTSIERFKLMNRFEPNHAESSSSAASRQHSITEECAVCTERFPVCILSRLPCSHLYCRECLVGLISSSLHDESLFPPRCCGQDIPVETGWWFPPTLVGQFRAKKLEFDTLNRTYCSEPSCSTFIPPAFIRGDMGWCPKCSQTTCVHCKGSSHQGVCPSDSASQQALELAKENGWQRCYACERVIELVHGCYHITCRCKAEFCYVCGDSWKTCKCPQWHEHRLLNRANAIVDRQNDAGEIDQRARELRVAQERRNLIENHECTHANWEMQYGSHCCEECSQRLSVFILVCCQCRIMACRRCSLSRLRRR